MWRSILGGGACAGFALALIATLPARAQIETNSKSPIDITANEAEVLNQQCLAIWRGDAEALQDKSRLRADTISVYTKVKGKDAKGEPSCGATDRIIADGHVFYVTPDETAKGAHAVYSSADDMTVLTGDVVVVQGKDVARGDRLTIKVSTREARMYSNVTGAGRLGRVRGVFYPAKNDTTGTPTPAATAPAAGAP